jgi:hypothetical protein
MTEVYRSSVAQALFYVDGRPLSLEHYPMYPAIYDGKYSRLLLKTGRQVAKSTTIACFMIAEAIGTSQFKSFYISPSQEQTRKFSHTRIAKILSYSPDLRKSFVGPESIDNVLLRMLRNGSELAFTYALDDPDRARGFSADRCAFDEVQDILYESVIPVIEECMSNSKFAYSVYAGTPKTTENTIEFLWSLSSQTEWCMKCTGCGKYTFIDGVKAVGKMGPICLNGTCGKYLNPRDGVWVDTGTGQIKGFHIAQPIMPENVPAAWPVGSDGYKLAIERWEKLLFKMESPLYGEARFLNECIGVSTSTGVRLLTQEILHSLCEDYEMTREPVPDKSMVGITRTFAGVDWSGGGGEVKGSEGALFKSRTVLHIWGQDATGRLKTLYYKVFPNGHAVGWIDEIVELCNKWNVAMICGDAGEGALANALLRQRLGDHRVVAIRYMALSKPVEWNPNALTYHVDRTTIIDNYARYLMHKQAIFPRITQSQVAFNDILNVYEEVTLAGRKVWRHSPTAPDDALHAQIFGWFAWRLLTQNLSFM